MPSIYDETTKRAAIGVYAQAVNEGELSQTKALAAAAQRTGIPASTIRGWLKAGVQPPDLGELGQVGELRAAVDRAVDAMPWVTVSDGAAVELARRFAEGIDRAFESDRGREITKALNLGPHLLNVLRELGGTPAARKTIAGGGAKGGGKLGHLRSIAGGKS